MLEQQRQTSRLAMSAVRWAIVIAACELAQISFAVLAFLDWFVKTYK